MQIYNCHVRLGRADISPMRPMEVLKENVTAPEIMIFRYLHGDDSVLNIIPLENDRRSHKEERERLEELYTNSNSEKYESGASICQKLFGPVGSRLPVYLDGVEVAPKEELVETEQPSDDDSAVGGLQEAPEEGTLEPEEEVDLDLG